MKSLSADVKLSDAAGLQHRGAERLARTVGSKTQAQVERRLTERARGERLPSVISPSDSAAGIGVLVDRADGLTAGGEVASPAPHADAGPRRGRDSVATVAALVDVDTGAGCRRPCGVTLTRTVAVAVGRRAC